MAISGDAFGCHNGAGGATGIKAFSGPKDRQCQGRETPPYIEDFFLIALSGVLILPHGPFSISSGSFKTKIPIPTHHQKNHSTEIP